MTKQSNSAEPSPMPCSATWEGGPNNAVIAWFREFVISRHVALGSFPSRWMVLERKPRSQDIDLLAFLCPAGSLPVASAFNSASGCSLGLLWLFLDDKTQNQKDEGKFEIVCPFPSIDFWQAGGSRWGFSTGEGCLGMGNYLKSNELLLVLGFGHPPFLLPYTLYLCILVFLQLLFFFCIREKELTLTITTNNTTP